jgi:hypothetical protein
MLPPGTHTREFRLLEVHWLGKVFVFFSFSSLLYANMGLSLFLLFPSYAFTSILSIVHAVHMGFSNFALKLTIVANVKSMTFS